MLLIRRDNPHNAIVWLQLPDVCHTCVALIDEQNSGQELGYNTLYWSDLTSSRLTDARLPAGGSWKMFNLKTRTISNTQTSSLPVCHGVSFYTLLLFPRDRES